MSKISLTTSAIVAGIGLNLPTIATANDARIIDAEFTSSDSKNELKIEKEDLGYNPKGGLIDSGICCADCRDIGTGSGN